MHNLSVYNYKEAYTTNCPCYFDEGWGVSYLFNKNNIKCYEEIDFADINYKYFHFEPVDMKVIGNFRLFYWDKGKLYGYNLENESVAEKEFAYLHLQKRQMESEIKTTDKSFAVIPNKFILLHEKITNEFISKHCKTKLIYTDFIKTRFKVRWGWIKTGGIKQKYIKLLKKHRAKYSDSDKI
jgi:hypothetical protein